MRFLALLLFISLSAYAGQGMAPLSAGKTYSGGGGTVVFDSAASSATNCSGGTTCAFNITLASVSNSLLAIPISWQDGLGSTVTVSSVAITVCASAAATQLSGAQIGTGGASNNWGADIWYWLPTASGSCTVTVTMNTAVGNYLMAGGIAFTGVSQSVPFGTPATAAAQTTGASVTAAGCTSTTESAIGVIGATVFSALTSGDTQRWNVLDGNQAGGGQSQVCGDGVMDWSGLNNFSGINHAAVAVAIKHN